MLARPYHPDLAGPRRFLEPHELYIPPILLKVGADIGDGVEDSLLDALFRHCRIRRSHGRSPEVLLELLPAEDNLYRLLLRALHVGDRNLRGKGTGNLANLLRLLRPGIPDHVG